MGSEQLFINGSLDYVYNITVGHGSMRETCQINAMNMLNNINKVPKFAFLFLVIALISWTLYIFWTSRSRSKFVYKYVNDIVKFLGFFTLICATYFYLFLTFDIDSSRFFSIVQPILYVIAISLALKIVYDKWTENYK